MNSKNICTAENLDRRHDLPKNDTDLQGGCFIESALTLDEVDDQSEDNCVFGPESFIMVEIIRK
jgi:hypothetical protein